MDCGSRRTASGNPLPFRATGKEELPAAFPVRRECAGERARERRRHQGRRAEATLPSPSVSATSLRSRLDSRTKLVRIGCGHTIVPLSNRPEDLVRRLWQVYAGFMLAAERQMLLVQHKIRVLQADSN